MKRLATKAAMMAMMMAACGGGGGGGPGNGPSGVDRSKQVSAVTDAEKSSLCDWYAPMFGGYGTTPACTNWLISAPPDLATCLSGFPACAVSIGQFEDCVVAIAAAQNVCTPQALDDVLVRPDCQAVGAAHCFD